MLLPGDVSITAVALPLSLLLSSSFVLRSILRTYSWATAMWSPGSWHGETSANQPISIYESIPGSKLIISAVSQVANKICFRSVIYSVTCRWRQVPCDLSTMAMASTVSPCPADSSSSLAQVKRPPHPHPQTRAYTCAGQPPGQPQGSVRPLCCGSLYGTTVFVS